MVKRGAVLVLVAALFGCGDDSPDAAAPSSSSPSPAASPPAAAGAVTVAGAAAARVENVFEGVDVKVTPQDPAGFRDAKTKLIGPVWRFRAGDKEHHAFQVPVTIHLPYDPALVPAGHRVGIAVWQDGRWVRLPDAQSNALKRSVSVSVDHFSDFAPTAYEEGIHIVGRWYGSAVQTEVNQGSEPTERSMGKTGFTTTNRFKWAFREESHDRLAFTRTIAESASWSVTMTESRWLEGQGPNRTPLAHPELRVGRSYGEGELNGPMSADDKRRLSEAEAEIAKLRPEVARLEAEYSRAGEIDRPRIESEYESAKAQLDSAERSAIAIRFEPHAVFAGPFLQQSKDPNTNDETWTVSCSFDGHATHYDFVSYDAFWPDAARKNIAHNRGSVVRGLSLSNPQITAPPSGPFRWTFSERAGSNEVHEYFGTSQPHTTDREITLKGRVVHRLRVPKNDGEANVILAAGEWSDDGVIAPAGAVRVGAWLADAGATAPPDAPPDHVVTAAADGTFALSMLLLPGKSMILGASWASGEARLTERQWASIPTDTILGAAVAEGAELPITEGIARSGVATVRYAKAKKDLDLGPDPRGGVLRRKDGGLELEFDKSNAILLGSFVFRAPHINQNTFEVSLRADVPPIIKSALIALSVTPAQRREVEDRLAADAPGDVTTVRFPGWVVCAPTCCTMVLRGLGFSADENTLPQEIYDHRKANDRLPDAPPWVFPFQYDPDLFMEFLEAVTTFASDGSTESFLATILRLQILSRNAYGGLWPYVPLTTYTQKQWLTTVETGPYRPWQTAEDLERGLEAKYPGQLDVKFGSDDVFGAAATSKVLNRLGAGRMAMVSIDHTSRERAGGGHRPVKGGHYLALVGAITNAKGEIVRLIFNDPYGDLTQRPQDVGYYDPRWYTGGADTDSDVDKTGHAGAYAPYAHPDVNAYDGRIYSKYWLVLNRTDQPATAATVRGRLLPGE